MEAVRKRAGALHVGLFIAALFAAVMILQPWPWYLLLPMLAYAAIILAVPPLRRTAPRLAVGRLGGAPLACAIILCVATSAVLLGFQALARPDMSDLAARIPVEAFGHWVLAGVCFSIVNAVLEEVVFRGLLWELVADERGNCVALGMTAVVFGILHLHGYPPGLLGAVLAGLYGLALGLLRWWTGGLGLAVACHVCADATIFGLLIGTGAFGQRAE
jgi:membrane protease YdiL (CAAX protease family)